MVNAVFFYEIKDNNNNKATLDAMMIVKFEKKEEEKNKPICKTTEKKPTITSMSGMRARFWATSSSSDIMIHKTNFVTFEWVNNIFEYQLLVDSHTNKTGDEINTR